MRKEIRQIESGVTLFRDDMNGIAWIEDTRAGIGISVHPNIDVTGSVEGMVARGYWGKNDRIVESHGWIYNIDRFACWPEDEMEQIVAKECRCQACIERRAREEKRNDSQSK